MNYVLRLILAPLRGLALTPRRLLELSLPARIAMLVAVFLVICVVSAYGAFYFSHNRTPWEVWWRPGRMAALVLLVIVIPLVVYQALRLWLEGEVSRFPDIDYAWKAGVAELERNGLDLAHVPIFVVLGSSGDAQERALFRAARLNSRVSDFPTGQAALHWYAGPDAAFLCLTEVGQLGRLAELGEKVPAGSSLVGAAPPSASVDALRGTIMAGAEPAPQPAPSATGSLPQQPAAGSDIRGTMMIAPDMHVADLVAALGRNQVSLAPQEANEQLARLEYVCRLLRRARQPLCPINGLLALLPYAVLERGPREGTEVGRVLKADLAVLRQGVKLRCPVTAMVVGLDREAGFRELVRRVGADRARGQRFGKGFGLWNLPAPTQLEALCVHACGAFEDWVYTLFREAGSLSKPGNLRLYALLCKVRRNLQPQLGRIFAGALVDDHDDESRKSALLFGGCYFASAGEGDDSHAFVKGVLDKLPDQQEDLEWTPEAIAEEQRYRQISSTLWAVDALLLLALAGMIVYGMTRT